MNKRSKSKTTFKSIPKDTYLGITWSQFLKVIKQYGFEIITQRQYTYQREPRSERHFIVAAHQEKKLLLRANSFKFDADSEEKVNDIAVYGTLRNISEKSIPEQTIVLLDVGAKQIRPYSRSGNLLWEFSIERRNKLLQRLSDLEDTFTFVNWEDPNRFIWLLDNNEYFDESCDWKEIRDRFIANAPDWVREFITKAPDLK
jgi:hypothetical protein